MAIGIPVQRLIEEFGHDGGEVIFPDQPEPMCRRGFHSQELVQVAWNHGFACTPIELFPVILSTDGQSTRRLFLNEPNCWARFEDYIRTTRGVLEGVCVKAHHAVHYSHGEIFDPDGYQYAYSPKDCEAHGLHGKRLWIFTQR
jgi:hypothetical protein